MHFYSCYELAFKAGNLVKMNYAFLGDEFFQAIR